MAIYKINSCFGSTDKEFARHPSDLERAYELLGKFIKDNMTWEEAKALFSKSLIDAGASKSHYDTEMKRIESMIRPWID
ncbi:hypothetical protein ICN42_02225 [Polynucleobacter sp. 71A-WALBACH]|uniref:hypothetical protein n=1 Tax=Polynucleobacter sp. 71A-WALBACH TaxID=2689097 RepID=UPI001C0C9165|nr:hypothetical protein [Polynucleobacter sp. 71A-WALBACH]MBU3592916.1 hypothetical protein [Polynucleobacter sp. 71A-WALBACH]